MVWILLAFILMSVTLMTYGAIIMIKGEKLAVLDRLDTYTQESKISSMVPELSEPLGSRLLLMFSSISNKLIRSIISNETRAYWEEKLSTAGNPYGLNVNNFLTLRYFILGIAVVIGLLTKSLMGLIILTVIGYMLPILLLKSSEKQRRNLILKSLPDILDLLCVSVEAGLGFDGALQKVIEKSEGPLIDEFEKTLQEINMGKQRRDALRDMAARVNVNDVTVFLGAIIQADQLGVNITNVLRIQSQQVRANRRMQAEEKAQQVPIKILIPLVLFIFPSILIVLLGPAIIQIMDTLAG
ncbi:MAG TPA: type II secretion system F family protein [Syntrophomonadaceae bacterium]|nr:type II secretion system F family protein [Syntrophomonadaceae bacterium]